MSRRLLRAVEALEQMWTTANATQKRARINTRATAPATRLGREDSVPSEKMRLKLGRAYARIKP